MGEMLVIRVINYGILLHALIKSRAAGDVLIFAQNSAVFVNEHVDRFALDFFLDEFHEEFADLLVSLGGEF